MTGWFIPHRPDYFPGFAVNISLGAHADQILEKIVTSMTIRTSATGWLEELATAYKHRLAVLIVDDARIGIDPSNQTLFDMARLAGLSAREIAGVCVALGMSAVGIAMVVLAFVDPEPTSKLGLLVVGGAVCVLGGGFTAIRILTNLHPPNVYVGKNGLEISWP